MSFHKNNKTMVSRNLFVGGILISMVLILTNCENMRCIKGNDNITTEEVDDIDTFDKIYVEADYEVLITQDTVTKVSILADDNLIPYITIEVAGGELILTTANDRCLRSKNDIRVYVSSPLITRLEVEGSGDIFVNDITLNDSLAENAFEVISEGSGNIDFSSVFCDELIIDLVGSGDIYFSDVDVLNTIDVLSDGSGDIIFQGGIGDVGIYTVEGSGNIEADRVELTEADVKNYGSGDIYVWAIEILFAETNASGNIYYRQLPIRTYNFKENGTGLILPLPN